jgi:hypothetical protein
MILLIINEINNLKHYYEKLEYVYNYELQLMLQN